MRTLVKTTALALATLPIAGAALAAGGDLGQTDKQPTNWVAIIMFAIFVAATLWITKWAAGRTRSATPAAWPARPRSGSQWTAASCATEPGRVPQRAR